MTVTPAPLPTRPRYVRQGDALYLDIPGGCDTGRWRVHWICYGYPPSRPGHALRLRVGDARANYFYFVRPGVRLRVYHRAFRGRSTRPTSCGRARMLAVAGWISKPEPPKPPRPGALLGG